MLLSFEDTIAREVESKVEVRGRLDEDYPVARGERLGEELGHMNTGEGATYDHHIFTRARWKGLVGLEVLFGFVCLNGESGDHAEEEGEVFKEEAEDVDIHGHRCIWGLVVRTLKNKRSLNFKN